MQTGKTQMGGFFWEEHGAGELLVLAVVHSQLSLGSPTRPHLPALAWGTGNDVKSINWFVVANRCFSSPVFPNCLPQQPHTIPAEASPTPTPGPGTKRAGETMWHQPDEEYSALYVLWSWTSAAL